MNIHNGVYFPADNKSFVIKALIKDRIWEKPITKLIQLIKHNDNAIALDIGSYIGTHSQTMIDCGFTVHAFEPQSLVYECLKKTAESKLNGITIHNNFVSNTCDESIDFVTDNDGDARARQFTNSRRVWKDSYKVTTVCIDSFNFENVRLMKIDVEGAELLVLKGSEATISRHRPVIIIESFNSPRKRTNLFQFFDNLKYSLIPINSTNFLCLP